MHQCAHATKDMILHVIAKFYVMNMAWSYEYIGTRAMQKKNL